MYLFIYCLCVCLCSYVSLCASGMYGAYGGQKRESVPLVPELQAVATCLMGVLGTEPCLPREQCAFLPASHLPQTHFIGCGTTEAKGRFFGLSYRKPLLTQSDLGALACGPSDSGG